MDTRLIKRGHDTFKHPVLSDLMCSVLLFVRKWISDKGYPPLFNEIEDDTGIHKNTVQHCIEALVKYGYVQWNLPRGRGFDLTFAGQTFSDPRIINKRNLTYKHSELNDSAYEIMVTINSLTQEKRIPPTQAEIMRRLDLNST